MSESGICQPVNIPLSLDTSLVLNIVVLLGNNFRDILSLGPSSHIKVETSNWNDNNESPDDKYC
jgi:hypothetical protein